MQDRLALIGFGEAGAAFARAADWDCSVVAFDIAPERTAIMADCGARAASSMVEALASARLVLSLVTADQALVVARTGAPLLAAGALWCDMNSVAPETKRAAANAVENGGGRYVDVAVMAPVEPAHLAVPLLLSGPAAGEAERQLRGAGFTKVRVVGHEIGRASAIKMIRSVMIKGIEALTAEMVLAAEAAGVTDEVLASLDIGENSRCWLEKADYNLERMATHGLRRAAEMEETAKTLAALGIEPIMTAGTIRRQREQAAHLHERI